MKFSLPKFGKGKSKLNEIDENISVQETPSLSQKASTTSPQMKKDKMDEPDTAEKALAKGVPSVKDIIAPSAIEVDYNYLKIGDKYFQTLFISAYPRFVGANWLEPIINFNHTLTITMYYYPVNARNVLDDLRRKIAEMEATINIAKDKGKVVDPAVQAALEDAKSLQEQLVKGIERFFHFSFYVTVSADTIDDLKNISYQVESTLGSMGLISKKATLDMENGFKTTLPLCLDKLKVIRNMDTTSCATTFPFTSSELTMNEGILYGVNKHNGSLIIFDRFSMENANSVIFAKSGSGKSYLVKLEALRSLLFGVDIIVIDPETEYRRLCDAVGGEYIDFNINSQSKINPFELPISDEMEDQLSLKILSLHALFKIMLGNLTNAESAVIDRAMIDTYKLKGITQDKNTQKNEPPLMEDLYKTLQVMEEPESKALAERLERYVKGSLSGIFDQRSNINLDNNFTVFSIRNLEDVLRPIAMFMILDFIWTKVKHNLKKRILILDEAWIMMQYQDSAAFVYSLAKRARKYYLGLTTITQDVADFLKSDYGKAVVTNSSIQILLKQHPASIDNLAEIFYLSAGEKNFLLGAGVGEGLFFAGTNHVAMQVKASKAEHLLITTNPKELLDMQRQNDLSTLQKSFKEKVSDATQKVSQQYQGNQSPISGAPIQPSVSDFAGQNTVPLSNSSISEQHMAPQPTTQYNPQSAMPNPYEGLTGDDENNYKSGTIILNQRSQPSRGDQPTPSMPTANTPGQPTRAI